MHMVNDKGEAVYFNCVRKNRKDQWVVKGIGSTVVIGRDPSGKDMTRDIADRLDTFGADVEVRRIALNWDQIDEYSPPPNPAKLTDSRASAYIQEFGTESWELDALEPKVLTSLIREQVDGLTDKELWLDAIHREEVHKEELELVKDNWPHAVQLVRAWNDRC